MGRFELILTSEDAKEIFIFFLRRREKYAGEKITLAD